MEEKSLFSKFYLLTLRNLSPQFEDEAEKMPCMTKMHLPG